MHQVPVSRPVPLPPGQDHEEPEQNDEADIPSDDNEEPER